MIEYLLNFAEDPSLIIGDCIIFDRVVGQFFLQSVHDLNTAKFEDNTTTGSTLSSQKGTGMSVTWSVWRVTWTWWYCIRTEIREWWRESWNEDQAQSRYLRLLHLFCRLQCVHYRWHGRHRLPREQIRRWLYRCWATDKGHCLFYFSHMSMDM